MTSELNGPPLALRTKARQTEWANADTHSEVRCWGGERMGGKRGHGAAGKTPCITAVKVRTQE